MKSIHSRNNQHLGRFRDILLVMNAMCNSLRSMFLSLRSPSCMYIQHIHFPMYEEMVHMINPGFTDKMGNPKLNSIYKRFYDGN